MNWFAVLLRGVNVNGITVKSADLRDCLSALPVRSVKTLLASGNVVLQTQLSAAELKKQVETALRERFNYDAWVVVLSGARVAELVAACPFPADSAELHCYLTLSSDPHALEQLVAQAQAQGESTMTQLGPEAVAWTVAVGQTLEAPASKLTAKAAFKASTTTRNLRTMIKIRDAAPAQRL
ncbi:DUF1697 domain-containing protein [Psychromicrobium xiongbiense]|uniref:DUF1697 domain-containing protein n=1 Tax=Psychromicrobium xiongbiense TaxID=3051184 RepID=UPI0025532278|nr:DUF1697 domain-containing protein [Psychromicrobium sp. YIM S02556]